MKKCFKTALYILSSIVGAGFASGKEIAVFLGKDGLGVVSAVVCAVGSFLLCALFLSVSAAVGGGGFAAVNKKLFPRLHAFFDISLILNFIIVLSAMSAAAGEIAGRIFPAFEKLYIPLFLFLSACVVRRGREHVVNAGYILMLFIVAVIIAVSVENFSYGESIYEKSPNILSCLRYMSLVMFMSAGTIVSRGQLTVKQRWLISAVVGTGLGILIFTLGYAIRCCGCETENIPVFALSSRLGKVAYYMTVLLIVLSAFTASTAAFGEISGFLAPSTGKTAAILFTAAAAYTIGLFGFGRVIELFYPVIGAIGIIFFAGALRYSAAAFSDKFFRKRYAEIHNGGKKT